MCAPCTSVWCWFGLSKNLEPHMYGRWQYFLEQQQGLVAAATQIPWHERPHIASPVPIQDMNTPTPSQYVPSEAEVDPPGLLALFARIHIGETAISKLWKEAQTTQGQT